MIKLVAFDWNGTLLSDTATCVRAENMALKAVGHGPISIIRFRQTFDIPIIKYWRALGVSESSLKKHIATIEDVFHTNYERFANQARTRAGAKAALRWLRQQKIGRVIYSNHNIPNIRRQLVRLRIEGLVDKILANLSPGGNPQVFARHKEFILPDYIKQRRLKAKEIISVGDTEEEIQIGKTYGFHTVAITGGYNTTARLRKHRPDFLIHNLAELKKIIIGLNKT